MVCTPASASACSRSAVFFSADCFSGAGAPAAPDAGASGSPKASDKQSDEKKSALREQALADAGVQTMLEVFPAEIRDVEEM
jgi:hypothetical protein